MTVEDFRYYGRSQSWEQTLAKSGLSFWGGVWSALMRFLNLHGIQPTVYLSALYVYWPELDAAQRMLGGIVAFREVLYIIGLAAMVYYQPSALLVDVGASWRSSGGKYRSRGRLLL